MHAAPWAPTGTVARRSWPRAPTSVETSPAAPTRAPYIVGPWLVDEERGVLDRLAGSDLVWDRRIAVMATFAFIRADDFRWTFRLGDRLLHDPHDLVRKAVGWMLREVGNRDRAAEEEFLLRRYRAMPRVMLRYAIEKFEPQRRRGYLSGTL
ncbi:DNA alkylation repair protein [Micromonospora sp. LAH09]|uniref:DNA alkylation repair protein n=1 Tax=Micromonospora cabrerizensis TaxID=2911213 RepID=UPI001EE8EB08|nr:DNA alkylation repair protein [Micromonospora cabrerizensis]MCG5471695.1 DNA alkylation repair protein [Micromonospora cabrerizensis]